MPDPLHPPQPYPLPGTCCEHSANAHSRDHCLVCDCQKPPQVIYTQQVGAPQPPPREDDDPSSPVLDLIECGQCHALLTPAAREAHLTWHEKLVDTLSNMFTALSALARQPNPKENTGE